MASAEKYHAFFSAMLDVALERDAEVLWASRTVPVNALAAAYPLGVFPWPGDEHDWIPWVCPLERGVLPLAKFRLGKSTRRHLKDAGFRVTLDHAFPEVIRACATFPGRDTWIHPAMMEAYTEAHRRGFAHSVEVWLDTELVGGLYGIDSGHFFSGESMFHRRDHAGKAAIAFLVDHLRARGDTVLDIQQLTPHMAALGAEEWSRPGFLNAIREHRGFSFQPLWSINSPCRPPLT